jgi:hypothetical protein
MKIIFKKIFYIILFALFLNNAAAFTATVHRITDYHQIFFPCYNKAGDLRIAIRMYYLDKMPYYLVVNPTTFATETAPAENFRPRKIAGDVSGHYPMQELLSTPYLRALGKYTSPPYLLQNQGVIHAEKSVNGVFLTADMCPSVKPFEADFFHTLVAISEKNLKPMPIALSITGLWIIGHPNEFNWCGILVRNFYLREDQHNKHG